MLFIILETIKSELESRRTHAGCPSLWSWCVDQRGKPKLPPRAFGGAFGGGSWCHKSNKWWTLRPRLCKDLQKTLCTTCSNNLPMRRWLRRKTLLRFHIPIYGVFLSMRQTLIWGREWEGSTVLSLKTGGGGLRSGERVVAWWRNPSGRVVKQCN